jgi:chemotaxis protein CheX
MNAPNPALRSVARRESWLPTLELAVQEIFELMLSCPLENPTEPPSLEGLDLAAMVGLAGQLRGMLTMRCRAGSAVQMASRMLRVELDEAEPAMLDAAGEVCNMVAGNFKNKVSGLGDGCVLSVPTVIVGHNYTVRVIVDEEVRTVMMFLGDPIMFTLEIHP